MVIEVFTPIRTQSTTMYNTDTSIKSVRTRKVQALEKEYPEAEVELWFFDEHRIGLKPILRKVWSKISDRSIAVVSHSYVS